MFDSIQEVHRYIASYCTRVFEKMDSELTPEVLLDICTSECQRYDPEIKEEIIFYHTPPVGNENGFYIFSLVFDGNVMAGYHQIEHPNVRSLLHVIIVELKNYMTTLISSFINDTPISETPVSDLIRRAGKRFLSELLELPYDQSPYSALNKIAALSYEKNFSSGKIILGSKTLFPSLFDASVLKFKSYVPLTRYRHARKLLELSKNNMGLLCDGVHLSGVISCEEHLVTQQALIVEFTSPSNWQLLQGDKKLMVSAFEDVFIPKPKISFYKFNRILKDAFPMMENKKIASLYRLVLEATKQTKGTIIILSKNARSEAYRLRHQGFLIEPLKLTPDIMMSITSIDGAVMVDLDGICHGIGVILDGIATEKGDPSRGARFNSVIRYVETLSQSSIFSNCLSIVVSEDGDVDIV